MTNLILVTVAAGLGLSAAFGLFVFGTARLAEWYYSRPNGK